MIENKRSGDACNLRGKNAGRCPKAVVIRGDLQAARGEGGENTMNGILKGGNGKF